MGVLSTLEKAAGLPPIKEVTELLSGENGKRIERILGRLDNLAKDKETIIETARLLQLVKDLNNSGALEKLVSILNSLPRGKAGENMVVQLRLLMEGMEGKLDKLTTLAAKILSTED